MPIILMNDVIEAASQVAREMLRDGGEIRKIPLGRAWAYVATQPELLVEPSAIPVEGRTFYVSPWRHGEDG